MFLNLKEYEVRAFGVSMRTGTIEHSGPGEQQLWDRAAQAAGEASGIGGGSSVGRILVSIVKGFLDLPGISGIFMLSN